MTQAFNLSQFANKVNTSGQASLTTAVTGTLPVANGGTNQTTYTDGQLLIGNTTGNTLTKATLTAGSGVTITNGSGAITIAAAGGGFSTMQVFASPGTFTTPSTTTKIKVTVVGGGGGGGVGGNVSTPFVPTNPTVGGKGASGAVAIYVGPVTASTPYAVTIGAQAASATAGNTSSFGPLVSCTGGGAGAAAPGGGNGTGGTATSGTLNLPGAPGGQTPAIGGSNIFGIGGANGGPNAVGAAGFGFGSGGGGGNGAGRAGGVGSAGLVIVEY
jgi:hypothetical protein